MKRILSAMAVVAAVVITSAACSRSKVIPNKTLKKIYAEIFIADQIISEQYGSSRMLTDTTLMYESILRKYGYTVKDYQTTLEYNMSDPMIFTRTIKASGKIIDKRLKEAQAEEKRHKEELKKLEALEAAREALHVYAPEKYFFMVGLSDTSAVFAICDSIKVYVDSTGRGSWMFDLQKGRDTVFYGPAFTTSADTSGVASQIDSLKILKAQADSLKAAKAGIDEVEATGTPDYEETREKFKMAL